MDSNNHFNYGTSTNSGLKLSSGDSLYTNGSSMSFPQQGKNLNGEMNVNGVTTVHGSNVSGSHPPSAPYPHMSGHHQGGVGYEYLYGPGMGSSSGQGVHQKQPAPGITQSQSQHHFQSHSQYQLNGGVEASHQPPIAGQTNVPLTGNSQYWNRSNPTQQQMSYNSPSMYGSFHSQSHPMMTNGMPFYQPPQQQLPQQSQSQTRIMPPAAQNFTPPRGSPQHHSLGRGSSSSPLPVGMSPTPVVSPPIQDCGSPKGLSRDRSPHTSSAVCRRPKTCLCLKDPGNLVKLQILKHQIHSSESISVGTVSSGPPASSSSEFLIDQTKAVGNSDSPNLAASSLTSERHAPDLVRTESHVAAVETKKPEVCQYKSPTDPPGKSLQASEGNLQNASDLEKHEVKSSILSGAADSPVASTPIGKPPHLKSTSWTPRPALSRASLLRLTAPEKAASRWRTPEMTPWSRPDILCCIYKEVDPITAAINAVLANASALSTVVQKPKKMKRVRKQDQDGSAAGAQKRDAETTADDGDENDDSSTAGNETGESNRRRVASEEQVQFPLQHGWKREIRVKKMDNRMKGETWYYTPCGRRMKQFPEIIKYLKKHSDGVVSREHFSFSPRMPVGDFYEERETSEGVKWVLLANEEVPSMIMAITGRRGRPPNPDKEKPRRIGALKAGQARRPGRPPKFNAVDLLSKVDAKLLNRLEAKGERMFVVLAPLCKSFKGEQTSHRGGEGEARMKRREDLKIKKMKEEKKKAKPSDEKVVQSNRAASARSKAKALAKAQAEAEAAAQAALAAKRAAERRAQAQRRLEERKRQQLIAEELKKPTEDMCLTDHKPLPELSRVPGLVLSGTAFAHCLAVVEFLHGYGKIIGINVPKDIPSLSTLQEGLLGLGDSQGEVQDLLIKLVESALHDPGLPSYYQSVKILGEKLVDLELTRNTVSEVLRIYLESHGYETEVCNTLRTKTFHILPPDTKAAILGFLVEELNSSNIVMSDIDNTLENMATYRKNKWIIERKLRKLKPVLARRTGRSEEELCFEERRRSARVAEEENFSLEESGLVLERGSRRARKEESESPTTASIPELERQIDKLTKRQAFFRKKLLQSSHSMRVVMLGQDRYRRRYLALPHLGGVLVEGPEELLKVPVTFLKKEPKVEEIPVPTSPPAPASPSATPSQPQTASVEDDPLPGTASLMSTQRGRGRPRKIKPEVELHLRTAKIRRRRRSSVRSVGEEGPGSPNSGLLDLTQAAFKSWLSQSQDVMTNGGGPGPAGDAPEGGRSEESIKEMAEKHGQWFNLLPKQPCDDNSLTEPQTPASPGSPPKLLPQIPSALPALAPPTASPPPPAAIASPPAAPVTPGRPARRRRRGSSPARRGPRGAAAKRRGRPPNAVFQELEQQYFTQLVVKPIPASMVRGWWWIKDPEELYHTLQALHPRGIREKVLHKHLAKHMESLAEMCTKPINDPLFELKTEDKDVLLEALQQPWQVQEKAMEVDVSALQWVEDLEQRVIAADLHLKPYTIPDSDSTRDDLQYYEHDVDPRDDWIVRTKKEWSGLPRIATHPLDLAVLRLANLERNIERRYLKEPLWNPSEVMRLAPLTPTPGEELSLDVFSLESEITSRLRTWRQALDRCRSAPQLCLCVFQLEKAIAWERSVTKVTCQVCRKGDNDECLLLCDGCDRGCHMYCLKPKITQVPEGDWFCPTCVPKKMEGELQSLSKKRTRTKKRRYEEDSSEDETTKRRSGGMTTRHKEAPVPSSSSSTRYSGERRRITTRNQPDLTFCEIILMEMEAHADAWPFLEPVNPRLVPGYRRIIKNPMDFLTMRERLLQGAYCSCDEFAADAQLVFNNCELFNEDTSEVGMAGHSMRRFFESRWAEFYSNKDKSNL
uniref:Bromodomain adjacent to zinc finger domain, 2A n=1 Tax=Poecilia formosa TaxID=48698 RepID=A0A087Y1P6_POEFO